MRNTIDIVVYVCMFIALYHNLTSIPHPQPVREIRGLLEKFQYELPN